MKPYLIRYYRSDRSDSAGGDYVQHLIQAASDEAARRHARQTFLAAAELLAIGIAGNGQLLIPTRSIRGWEVLSVRPAARGSAG